VFVDSVRARANAHYAAVFPFDRLRQASPEELLEFMDQAGFEGFWPDGPVSIECASIDESRSKAQQDLEAGHYVGGWQWVSLFMRPDLHVCGAVGSKYDWATNFIVVDGRWVWFPDPSEFLPRPPCATNPRPYDPICPDVPPG
jgi:hypothetical protein